LAGDPGRTAQQRTREPRRWPTFSTGRGFRVDPRPDSRTRVLTTRGQRGEPESNRLDRPASARGSTGRHAAVRGPRVSARNLVPSADRRGVPERSGVSSVTPAARLPSHRDPVLRRRPGSVSVVGFRPWFVGFGSRPSGSAWSWVRRGFVGFGSWYVGFRPWSSGFRRGPSGWAWPHRLPAVDVRHPFGRRPRRWSFIGPPATQPPVS
jgi:hypothetical protein